jgi:hypothetical protein
MGNDDEEFDDDSDDIFDLDTDDIWNDGDYDDEDEEL